MGYDPWDAPRNYESLSYELDLGNNHIRGTYPIGSFTLGDILGKWDSDEENVLRIVSSVESKSKRLKLLNIAVPIITDSTLDLSSPIFNSAEKLTIHLFAPNQEATNVAYTFFIFRNLKRKGPKHLLATNFNIPYLNKGIRIPVPLFNYPFTFESMEVAGNKS